MTYVEAFKTALMTSKDGGTVRRLAWHDSAKLRYDGEGYLERWPVARNWEGQFSPSIADVQATDWAIVDPTDGSFHT